MENVSHFLFASLAKVFTAETCSSMKVLLEETASLKLPSLESTCQDKKDNTVFMLHEMEDNKKQMEEEATNQFILATNVT